MKHALIIGSGLAGPMVAMALQKAGLSSTIYEAYPEGAGTTVGAWLTVAVNGLDAMRTLGVAERVREVGFPSRDITLVNGEGKTLGVVPIGGELPDGTVTHTMKRADLHRVLLEEARARGIEIVHDRRLDSAEQRGDRVVARFHDGSTAEGDLLIGADGIRSRVRTLIDPHAKDPRYTGLGNVGGFTSASSVRVPAGTYAMVFGKRAFFGYTTTPTGDTWWFANPPRKTPFTDDDARSMDTAAWKAHLTDLFRDDVGPMVELIANAEGRLVGMSQYELGRVKHWQRGRIVLVGDAAHAASPSSGQGASMAAEDAVTLGACLRGGEDVEAALARFVALRRARAERVIAHGARSASGKAAGVVGRAVRDLVLPFFLRRLGTEEGKRELSWLYDHRVAW